MSDTLDLRELELELRELVAQLAPPQTTLLLVDSVQDWAHAKGLKEANPFRQATSFPTLRLIVMLDRLTEDLARSSGSILHLGPIVCEALARDFRHYARFLVLHEIAHLLGMLDEKAADGWAFARLNEVLERSGEPTIDG